MNKLSEEEKINEFFIECFNNILREEETKLKSISNNNLSVSEFHIIETIANLTNSSSKIIAKQLGVTAGTLTVAINTLEKKGYVIKTKDEADKRVIRLSLTSMGQAVNVQHEEYHEAMVKGIVKVCNKRELMILTKALAKINNFFMEKKDENSNNNR